MAIYAMTGGATGIGAATKDKLRAAGHTVIVVDLKDADINADLSTASGREAAIEGIKRAAPEGLDGFIPCAGLGPAARPFSLITRVNYFAAVEMTIALKESLAAKRGSIVMVSSNSAPMGADPAYVELLLNMEEQGACELIDTKEAHTAYAGSKLALAQWMRRNTTAFAQACIRINAVAPGITRTPLTDMAFKDEVVGAAMKDFSETVPLGYVAEPEQIADGIVFLLSDAASFIAGSVLFIDGGHDAMLRPDQF
jgi:NAD(P)-dependent dehydrogenase (short-subunit alcohol dehydrogenase family)